MSVVEWRHDGKRPILGILVLPPGMMPVDGVSASALIDTGATTSGISGDIVRQLGLRTRGRRPLSSAHSDDLVDRYIFRIALHADGCDPVTTIPYIFETVEGFQIRDGFSFNAIIGMDILRQCDLELSRGGRCRLRFGYT